ncbi:MAG: putative quinol monooxygenase [Thermoguttaceae bacterium]
MAKEPGVLLMYSMADKEQPNQITIVEIYVDHAAYKAHIQTPHFQKYKTETIDMIQKLELLDQTPLLPKMKMK